MEQGITDYLKRRGIIYTLYEHPAVFTCEEAAVHCKHVPGLAVKNLFLRDRAGEQYFLVVLPAEKRLQMKDLAKRVGVKELRFGKPEELAEVLQLTPGSVSPLGLMHDTNHRVQVLVDSEIWNAEAVSIHPNINTASLSIPRDSFHKLIESFGNSISIL